MRARAKAQAKAQPDKPSYFTASDWWRFWLWVALRRWGVGANVVEESRVPADREGSPARVRRASARGAAQWSKSRGGVASSYRAKGPQIVCVRTNSPSYRFLSHKTANVHKYLGRNRHAWLTADQSGVSRPFMVTPPSASQCKLMVEILVCPDNPGGFLFIINSMRERLDALLRHPSPHPV
jgi:hypothetical protein